MSVTEWETRWRMIRRRSGSPAMGTAALARTVVSGIKRVPRPAQSTRAVWHAVIEVSLSQPHRACAEMLMNVFPIRPRWICGCPGKPRSDRDFAANRTRLRRAECNPRHDQADEDIHRETFERERREAQIADDRHLEDPDSLHEWDGVVPLRVRPVIPELPEHAAQHS